jgi:hypothetical protein
MKDDLPVLPYFASNRPISLTPTPASSDSKGLSSSPCGLFLKGLLLPT